MESRLRGPALAERLRLYLVLPDIDIADQLALCRCVAGAGVGAVQFRAKTGSFRELLAAADAVGRAAREAGALFIVNDRVDVALAAGADGVHLGQDDMPAAIARRLIGGDMILGVSVKTDEQLSEAKSGGADYIGAGTVYATASKDDAGEPIGLAGLRRICADAGLPVVAIGGIGVQQAYEVMKAGASGIAVISAIVSDAHPEQACRALRAAIDGAATAVNG